MRHIIFIVLLFLLFYFGLSWGFSSQILHPNSSLENTKSKIQTLWGTSYNSMLAPLPKPEGFSIPSFDNIQLKGKYFIKNDSANCAIIAAHGWSSTWAGMLKYTPILEDCPCDLVFYDHRGHGASEDAYPTGCINESKDLLAITDWVQKEKGYADNQIGWLGASWGASAALKAGADKKNVAFIIADAPFQDWHSAIFERAVKDYGFAANFLSGGVMQMINWRTGVNYKDASPLLAAKHIEEPVLLIHSQMDMQTDSKQSVNIAEQLNGQSVFYHLDWGGGHTQDVLINREKFKKIVNDFLGKVNARFLNNKSN